MGLFPAVLRRVQQGVRQAPSSWPTPMPIHRNSNTHLGAIARPAARSDHCGCSLKRHPISSKSSTMSSSTKVEHKAVYDLGRKELKNRTEIKLDSGLKIGINYSDKTNLVSIDTERGPLKFGYDFQREDAVFQYTRKSGAGTIKARQVVPGMHWEVVPSPVIELSTRLLDKGDLRDSLKIVYDFNNRFAYYTDTIKFRNQFKVRIGGDSKNTDAAFCIGYKPDMRFVKSIKLTQTPSTGPLLSYKLKPAQGFKICTEASMRSKVMAASLSYKAQHGDTELVLDAAVPLPGSKAQPRLLQKAGVKMNVRF